jgi:hypothetical protein
MKGGASAPLKRLSLRTVVYEMRDAGRYVGPKCVISRLMQKP